MDFIEQTYREIKTMKLRKIFNQLVQLVLVVGSAVMLWKGLMLITNCESPVVVVLTGSMEPAYFRGDILFLHDVGKQKRAGDVIVFRLKDQEIPIVHRTLISQQDYNDQYVLSKGDNNPVDDRALYPYSQIWLKDKDMFGKIKGYLPYVGIFTIWLNDYPLLKWTLLGFMALFVIISKDPEQ